jgi:hypothetical protein
MPPRHFWWLYETLQEPSAKRALLSAQDKKGIKAMFDGNDVGGFW